MWWAEAITLLEKAETLSEIRDEAMLNIKSKDLDKNYQRALALNGRITGLIGGAKRILWDSK